MSMFVGHGPSDAKWSALERYTTPWAKEPFLEPILARALHFKRTVEAQVSIQAPQPSIQGFARLIEDGIRLSNDLDTATASIKSPLNSGLTSQQQPKVFNNMFEVSTRTTETIARCLYQTIRYRIVDLVLGLLAAAESGGNGADGTSFQSRPSKQSARLGNLCGEISAVLGLESQNELNAEKTGMAYRAFGIFWSLVILYFSPSAGESERAWMQEKLQFSGEATGFGLATWAATMINQLRPTQSV